MHVFWAFSVKSKERMQDVELAASVFPLASRFHWHLLTVLTLCHKLVVGSLVCSWFNREQPHGPKPHLRPLEQLGEVWERSYGGLWLSGVWKRVWGSSAKTAQPFQSSPTSLILNPEGPRGRKETNIY